MKKSNITKYIVALYSLLYGSVGMIGPMPYGPGELVYTMQSLIIATGIMLLIPVNEKIKKIMMFVTLGVYGVLAIVGIVVLFIIPIAAALVYVVIAIPVTLSVLTLVLMKKEAVNQH